MFKAEPLDVRSASSPSLLAIAVVRASRSRRPTPCASRPKVQILANGKPAENGIVLEDQAKASLLRRQSIHHATVDANFAVIGFDEPGDHRERRGLSAARWPEQRKEFVRLPSEVELLHRRGPVKAFG